MKFLRANAALMLLILISALCLFSFGIAIRVSLIRIQRQDQTVKPSAGQEKQVSKNAGQGAKINKFEEREVFFNGEKLDGLTAYQSDSNSTYVPLDRVFNKLNIPFQYFSSDDILEWTIHGKNARVLLGKQNLWLGKESIPLSAAPVAGKSHLLVPLDLFIHLTGFNYVMDPVGGPVFLNYYPEGTQTLSKLRALRQMGGTVFITDVFGGNPIWGKKSSNGPADSVFPSVSGTDFLLQTAGDAYLYNGITRSLPKRLQVPATASWSADGKYLYWTDEKKESSYIYNMKNKYTQKLDNSVLDIQSGSFTQVTDQGLILLDYQKGSRYERVAFTDTAGAANYSVIKRKGKTVIEGNLTYSPDRKKVVYSIPDDGYYFAYSDGSRKVRLGLASEVRWINNSRLWMKKQEGNYTVTENGKKLEKSVADWRMLGQTPQGEILFSAGKVLYYEKNGEEVKIRNLPWETEQIFCQSVKGPWILQPTEGKGTYYVTKTMVQKVGEDIPGKVAYSPDGANIGVLQDENGYTTVSVIDTRKGSVKKAVIHYTPATADPEESFMKWMSNSLLMTFSRHQWCVMDIKKDQHLYQGSEGKDSLLYGIFNFPS